MDGNHTKNEQLAGDAPVPGRSGAHRRTVCLLTTLNPDRGLSIALQQHLSIEVPQIEFLLSPRDEDEVDAIWICGYEPGQDRVVRTLRRRHPEAVIVITGRDPVEDWEQEVAQAGADFAFSWPVAYEVLQSVLLGGLPSKSLQARRRTLMTG